MRTFGFDEFRFIDINIVIDHIQNITINGDMRDGVNNVVKEYVSNSLGGRKLKGQFILKRPPVG